MALLLSAQVLHMFPPCLHKWWLGQFPEPAAWLQARLNFTRSVSQVTDML
jgi:serine/threonine-protein kinase ATR